MSGLEILAATMALEALIGIIPNKYVPYKSKILKVLSIFKDIGPVFKRLNDR